VQLKNALAIFFKSGMTLWRVEHEVRLPVFLVQISCEIRNDSAPESRGIIQRQRLGRGGVDLNS
jgi:hypothetical protein